MWNIMFKSTQLQYNTWHEMFCLHCCCCCSALCFKTVNQGCLLLLTVLLTSLGPQSITQCQQVFPCCTVYLAWLVLGARTGFRCLSPFKIRKKNIYLEQSVWADLTWNPFWKHIASICLWPNHSGNFFNGNLLFFVEVIFNFSLEIEFFGITWRVTLL